MEERDSELWNWKKNPIHGSAGTAAASKQEGVTVDVVNCSYTVTVGGKVKQLLRDVNLNLQPGEMCALMGPSGAGKRYITHISS